jgi:hypothetical protein
MHDIVLFINDFFKLLAKNTEEKVLAMLQTLCYKATLRGVAQPG